MHPQRIRFSGSPSCTLLFVTGILLILLLAACSPASSNAGPSLNTGTPNVDTSTPTATPQATATSTSSPTATPTKSAVTPTPIPTAAPIPFRVTSVGAAVNTSNYSGTCSSTKTFTITGTIYAPANNAGGSVTYDWTRSDNLPGAHHSLIFARGTTAVKVTYTWALAATLGNGTTKYWVSLKTLTPELVTSTKATFTFQCKREVASVSASVTPTTGCTTVTKIFVFNAKITISPGPGTSGVTVTYAWKRSNGTSKTFTVIVPAGQTTVNVVPDSWTLTLSAKKGTTYTDEVVTNSPNKVTSNAAKITC
jgi:outer membrane biogenesis lipoprotein LolB